MFFLCRCFICRKKEEEYKRITYDLTLNFANTKLSINSSRAETRDGKINKVFTYVSGVGTDSLEKGKSMWARVKGKTEKDLMNLPFKDVYAYRPGYIQPIKGLKNAYKAYKLFSPFYPVLEKLFPKYVGTLDEIGNSMINVTLNRYEKKVLEIVDIRKTVNR